MTSIKEIRKSKGVMQRAVADHLGVSRQTYRKYENHQEVMSVSQAIAVCEFLGCDVDQIFLSKKVN